MTRLQPPQELLWGFVRLLLIVLGPAYLLKRWWGWRGAAVGIITAPLLVSGWFAAESLGSYVAGNVRVPPTASAATAQLRSGSYDPDLRVPVTMDRGWRALVHVAIYRSLRRLLGPLPGAYEGPYPSADEALQVLLREGEPMLAGDVSGPVSIAGATVQVNDVGVLPPRSFYPYRGSTPARVAPLGSRGLLLLLPSDGRCSIFLYDESVGWFAQYFRLPCPR